MTNEENIQNELVNRFAFLKDKVKVQRARRIYADVPYENFDTVFQYAIKDLEFSVLCTITGFDEIQTFAFMYHLARPAGITLNLKINVPKEKAVIRTVTGYFPNADIYEREVADLFGVKVEGLAPGKRYPLPDDWPAGSYPLRKDWKSNNAKSKEPEKNA
jgi:Ni,Fe-hydrogenase III component G